MQADSDISTKKRDTSDAVVETTEVDTAQTTSVTNPLGEYPAPRQVYTFQSSNGFIFRFCNS